MFLIVGLGNPGNKYEGTRHNIGFDIVDYIAAIYNIKLNKLKFRALYGEGVIQGERVIIAKPQTFMNLSGECVRDIKEYYKLDTDNIIIIYDDVSLSPGRLRIRGTGSAGGHNGIKSIIYQLNSDAFPRIKIGVGMPTHADFDLADFVLSRFTQAEQKQMAECAKKAEQAIPIIMKQGVSEAMNRFNGN